MLKYPLTLIVYGLISELVESNATRLENRGIHNDLHYFASLVNNKNGIDYIIDLIFLHCYWLI